MSVLVFFISIFNTFWIFELYFPPVIAVDIPIMIISAVVYQVAHYKIIKEKDIGKVDKSIADEYQRLVEAVKIAKL